MWQRGCFPTKTPAWPRRLYRMRDRCAVLRTLLQCVCTQRRNCIGQLSPFSEYAPTALRNKWKPAATIKLIHYRRLGAKPHESSASGGYLGKGSKASMRRAIGITDTRRSEPRPAPRREPAVVPCPCASSPAAEVSRQSCP